MQMGCSVSHWHVTKAGYCVIRFATRQTQSLAPGLRSIHVYTATAALDLRICRQLHAC